MRSEFCGGAPRWGPANRSFSFTRATRRRRPGRKPRPKARWEGTRNALAEAGQNAESEVLMDRYRQRRPTQAPRGLMNYLSLTPEQQRADYRGRVEKAVRDNPGDANAQLHYLKLSLEESQVDQAVATGHAIAG